MAGPSIRRGDDKAGGEGGKGAAVSCGLSASEAAGGQDQLSSSMENSVYLIMYLLFMYIFCLKHIFVLFNPHKKPRIQKTQPDYLGSSEHRPAVR